MLMFQLLTIMLMNLNLLLYQMVFVIHMQVLAINLLKVLFGTTITTIMVVAHGVGTIHRIMLHLLVVCIAQFTSLFLS